MKRALALARRAQGTTGPLPPVGAVLVRDGAVVGEGSTQAPGGLHAEAGALAQAGDAARGATLYVTLEPCVHHGRTPPCADAIIQAGVAEVVHAGVIDENPQVAGRGIEALAHAGLRMLVDPGATDEARELAAPHAKFIRTGMPYVTAKFAASLDGKIATRTGESRWITGPAAQAYSHRFRAAIDAIIVGSDTVLVDDPELTARPGGKRLQRQPLRVVVDGRARTPPGAKVLKAPGRCLIAVGEAAPPAAVNRLEQAGATVIRCPGQGEWVDLRKVAEELAERDCINVLIEGGGELVGRFLDAGLVDRIMAFIAPMVIGGREAHPAVGGEGAGPLAKAWRLRGHRVRTLGCDLLVEGEV